MSLKIVVRFLQYLSILLALRPMLYAFVHCFGIDYAQDTIGAELC